MIDTHAHIYLPEFDEDRTWMLERAFSAGISRVLMPAIDSTTHEAMLRTEEKHPSCASMMGLHPCSVSASYQSELAIVEANLKERSFIAIGEIGLDFYWDKTFQKEQYAVFHHQVQLALHYDLPIVIHSRNATDECIGVVKEYKGIKGVFHCFSGTVEQAREIAGLGFLLGIGGVISFKNAGLDKVIAEVGMESVVLETDAPYLAPIPFRGKRNEPAYLAHILEKLAVVCGMSVEEVDKIATRNAFSLFKL
jgi:TatD DNase family protein